MGDFDDMIPEYITESTELLADVEGGFLALEEGNADEETIHTVFRAIHSIKGGAGFVGLGKIERLAHKMEDLLGLIRNHDMEATPEVSAVLIQGLDVLKALFDNVEDMDGIDIEPALRDLINVLEGTNESAVHDVATVAAPQDIAGLPTFDVSNYTLKNALQQGNVFYLKLDLPNLEGRGINPMELVSELLSMGEILDSNFHMPSLEHEPDTVDLSVDVLYSTVLEPDLLVAALYLEEGEYRLLTAKDFDFTDPDALAFAQKATPPPPKTETKEPAPQAVVAPKPSAPVAPQPSAASHKPAPPVAATAPVEAVAIEVPKSRQDKDYLTFRLEKEIYAVDILRVQEIIGVPHMARLPRSRKDVLGVMNLRGMVVPVFDLRLRLNLAFDPQSPAVVVVMRQEEKIMGGVVDEVRDVVHIKGQDMQDAPVFTLHLNDGLLADPKSFCLEGLTQLNNETIIVLNVDKVFAIGDS